MKPEAGDPLYPECEPRAVHRLAVGEGHTLYVEECGPADGLPVVFLHGGPGSGCSPAQRRLFDPARFRAILIDQRGCGRSTPAGGLEANTTAHLVADLERVRETLGISRWFVFGGSWGSLLGLAYAQAHPRRVMGMVLRGIFLGSREEVGDYARRVPLAAGMALGDDALAPWVESILGGSPVAAVRAWLDYERSLMGEPPLAADPEPGQLAKMRIQMHYLGNDCFVVPGALLAGMERLSGIPAAIVQGLEDPVCPPATARRLADAWPHADWIPVAGGGHGALSPPIAAACIGALERMADAYTS